MEELQNLIQSFGFPIIACIYMYKQQLTMNVMLNDFITTLKLIEKSIASMDSEIKQLKIENQKEK